MNTMMNITSSMALARGSNPVNAMGTATGGQGTNLDQASAFASLLLGIFTDAAPQTGQGTPLTFTLPASSNGIADTAALPQQEEEQALEELLEQLLHMLEAMPVEWKQQFAGWAPAQQWASAANVEVMIATGEPVLTAQPADSQSQQGAALDGLQRYEELCAIVKQLGEAISQEAPESPLRRIALEARQLVAGFVSTMSAGALTKEQAAEKPSSDVVAKALTQLSGTISTAPESPDNRTQPSSHLAAMESKFAAARVTIISESAAVHETAHPTETQQVKDASADTHVTLAAADHGKAAAADNAGKVEAAPQRMNAAFLADEMAEWILKQSATGRGGSVTEAKLSLMPEHLGQLEVKLTIHNGQVTAMFTAESSAAKDVLEANLAMLRTNLQNQGVQVDRLEVSQHASLGSGMFHEGRKRQPEGRESRQNKANAVESLEELDLMEAELQANKENQARMQGSLFHATA